MFDHAKFNPAMMSPPLEAESMGKSRKDRRDELRNTLIDLLVESVDTEDKPVAEALRYYNKITELCSGLVDYVKDAFGNANRSVPRERAARVNAVFVPIIETLEQFRNENV